MTSRGVVTWISPERAREILKAGYAQGSTKRPEFVGTCTAGENEEIYRVWKALRAESWWHALRQIAYEGRKLK